MGLRPCKGHTSCHIQRRVLQDSRTTVNNHKTKFRSHAVIVNALDLRAKLNNIFNTSWHVKLYDEQSIWTSFDFIDYLW
jgi:hypothetical protein